MSKTINLAVADDHPVVRFAIERAVAATSDIRVVSSAPDSGGIVAELERASCDVLLTDLLMPGGRFGDGVAMLATLRRRYPALAVVVLTVVACPDWLHHVEQTGVAGVISKRDPLACVCDSVRRAARGESGIRGPAVEAIFAAHAGMAADSRRLSVREAEVMHLYLGGHSVSAIAAMLDRSIKTISTQKHAAMRKLGLFSDADLMTAGRVRLGLAPPPAGPVRSMSASAAPGAAAARDLA
jgi:two-component system capsular synthesis response regulator RcsB